jgi:Carboxypeptidase regulatory-like domain/TonB-dependent Receptor Plug Domain
LNQLRRWLLPIACVVLLLAPMYGQKITGTISGSITDPSGAVVANASVTALNTATGASRTATSTSSGEFTIPELAPATYKVTVKAPNFKESVVNDVVVHTSSTAFVNAKLEVGGATEVMEVNANALQVQTDSAALGEVVEAQQVKELPLNGRSFVQLTQLAPGVSGANNYDSKNKGLLSGVDFAVNGNPTTNNLFLVDGANNNDTGSNRTILLYPSIEAISEFKMLRNSYSAEYGQASGAVVSLVTKSGTNDWHGSAVYAGRNSALNAADWFVNYNGTKKPVSQINDLGASIGGPIKKDKLFVFYSEEYNHDKRGQSIANCVPTAAEAAGDFSQDFTLAGNTDQCGATRPNLPAAVQAAGNPYQIANPSPGGLLMVSKYPLPNQALTNGFNWATTAANLVKFREENVRADFNLTQKNALMFRYTQDSWTDPAPHPNSLWGDDNFPALNSNWSQPSKMIIGKWTSQIGNSMVNNAEFSYSANRIDIAVGGTNPGLQDAISAAVPSLWPNSLKNAKSGIPTLWGGFNQYGNGQNFWAIAPWHNGLDIYSFRDDLSKVSGNHTLKFGFLYDHSGKFEDNGPASNERPTFGSADWATSMPTGNQLANILVPGAVWSMSEPSVNLTDHLQWRDWEFYADDTWKVRRNLTVELGLRYSLLYTPFNPSDQATSFQPFLYDPTKPASDACNGIWTVPGTDPCGNANSKFGTSFSTAANGPNKYLVNQNHHQFAPRIGIAWDPWSDGNWAFRVGVGQFFQRERVSGPYYSITNNAPFVINANAGKTLDAPTPATLSGSASPSGGRSPDSNTPNAWQWNASVEHSFAKDTVLQVGYVGNRGIHLTSNYDINGVLPGATAPCSVKGTNYGVQPSWTCAAFLDTNSAQNINSLRPFNNFGQLGYWTHQGDSYYHALQTLFKTRYKRSQLTAAYTWSHSIANVGLDDSNGGISNYSFIPGVSPGFLRGNSAINRPHIFTANFTYYLPELRDKAAIERVVLGGWEMSSIINVASGNSYTVNQGGISENGNNTILIPDTSNPGQFVHASSGLQALIGTGFNNNGRPGVSGSACDAGRSGNQIYNPSAFSVVGNQIGTLGSNFEGTGFCRGASLANWDFSVDKNFKLSERFKLQFRLDFFDILNHPNFRTDSGTFGSPINNVNCGALVPDTNSTTPGAMAYQPCSPTNNVITSQSYNTKWGQSNQTVGNAGREIQYSLHLTF